MANPKKRGRKFIIFGIIVLVLAGLTTGALLRKREAAITIETEKVQRRTITETVVANGKIQPVVQVKISAEVSGEIIDLAVKEGQKVCKGDLLVKIKPDFYVASRNQAEAGYKSSLAGKATSQANLDKAEREYLRNEELFARKLISDSLFLDFKTQRDVARAQLTSATHQVEVSRALLARAEEELAKTTIVSPLNGTISKLNSQLGERVLGTIQNVGTEIMIIADLNEMEARVDIGETDVVLMKPGQTAVLEVDAFKNKKFGGTVTEIGNSSKSNPYGGGNQQEATKFEVRIRVKEKEEFRPGMSVTAEIETRSHTNVLSVPFVSVTTRLPKANTNEVATAKSGATNNATATNQVAAAPKSSNPAKKGKDAPKQTEVVFVLDGERVKMVPVKIGISDDSYWEVTEGLEEGQEIVSGGHIAISRELEDGKKVRKSPAGGNRAVRAKNSN